MTRTQRYILSRSLVDVQTYTTDNYYDHSLGCNTAMPQPIEEILTLIAIRGKVLVEDIEQIFDLPNKTTRSILDFLIKFEFVRVNGKYLVLSETCSPFFEEIIS